jgi:hypothetical protein
MSASRLHGRAIAWAWERWLTLDRFPWTCWW